MHTFVEDASTVAFKHFRVLQAGCVINFHLEHSIYIGISKNIISYFHNVKMLFVILLPTSCKKNGAPFISYTFYLKDRG